MRISKFQPYFTIACLLFMFSSCIKDRDLYQKIPKENIFNFSLTQTIPVEIDYCLTNYVILFEIYDQNPFEEKENTLVKKEIEPLYRAATDKDGKYTGEITIPSSITGLWLVSDYIGTVSPVKIDISDGKMSFNQNEFIVNSAASTRGVSASGFSYLNDYLILGDWNIIGKPDYLLEEIATPPSGILYDISKTYTKNGNYTITANHPEYFDGNMSSDVKITKPTKINLVFLSSSAGWNNTVGYYTYPSDKKPQSEKDIQKIVAFPNASPLYYNGKVKGSLVCGSQVQLKYWDGTKFVDEFPAGITIGWFLQGMGFNNGALVKGMGTRYSTQNLNENNKQRAVSLRDRESNQIVAIGFEDNVDYDYCDATFYLNIEVKDAVDDSTLPPLPDTGGPTTNENYSVYYGTLAFEDQWPSEGDFDMNDQIVDYNCTIYKNIIGNKVSKIVDEFTPRYHNALFTNGFGYQFHNLTNSDIRKVTIEGPKASRFMNGQTLEEGQEHPTIILYDDIEEVVGEKYTITIELNDVENSMVVPPYNPFLVARTNQGRRREVHLVNYAPTSYYKVDMTLFGTQYDQSRPAEELYYISKNMMPFAIHLPQIKDFPIPEEKVRIDLAYPDFAAWVKSMGKTNKDWYKKK